jgi:SulP family sulfate permease
MPDGTATAHLLKPKVRSLIEEGYGWAKLRKDVGAGLTVAIVALPLSMAIAVASGAGPAQGIATAIVGGFLVSALGGSRFQIGGPAGAFIVLVSTAFGQIGPGGVALAILVSGAMLTLMGVLRIGALVRHIPHTVTAGFTAGIAVIIAASQVRDFAGLRMAHEPGPLLAKLAAIGAALPSLNPAAAALGVTTVALILLTRRLRPTWPSLLVGLAATGAGAAAFHLPVETIATRFGELPHGLPLPQIPPISLAAIQSIGPTALSFTLLGAIESLLSAKVADGLTARRHRSNMELVAQGAANMASALFGGLPVTGTIARTATNIRAGAQTPVAGMLHAAFLMGFMLVAAPLCGFAPLSSLAGVLLVVAWGMVEKGDLLAMLRRPADAVVLAVTFAVTVLVDLVWGIGAGCAAAGAFAGVRRLMATRVTL